MSWWRAAMLALALVLYALSGAIVARSPLGILNFLVLQWFGVRLARITCQNCNRLRTNVWRYRCPGHTRLFATRWIWPLTGWWSSYRYIRRRRPTVCRNHDDDDF